jgi:hypothetical protein
MCPSSCRKACGNGIRRDWKLRKKERIYDCAPQLNYEVFVKGTFEDQLKEYLRGIALSAPRLAGLGATPQQITAAERILVERPDKTRH